MSTKHIAIGLAGYRNDYKSTLLGAFLNNKTDLAESENHITLSINRAQIFKCASPDTTCYTSRKHELVGTEFCAHPGHESERLVLSRDVSFLGFPDKIEYASTVLGGIYILDGIFILSDAELTFSRLPTLELVEAASVLNKKVVLVQILKDTKDDTRIWEHHQEITQLIGKMNLDEPLIIPVSVSETSDIATLCTKISDMCIEKYDKQIPLEMLIIDNFLKEDGETGEMVLTLCARMLKEAAAGDIIAVRSIINYDQIGPMVVNLSGYIIGDIKSLPDVFSALQVKVSLLPMMFDSYIEDFKEVTNIEKDERLLLTFGMISAEAIVRKILNENTIVVSLKSPICARKKDKMFLLRPMNVSWRLIGHGQIENGKVIRIDEAIHG